MDVCVVGGAGHVGLVAGACLASLGHAVRCVDRDAQRIQALLRGQLPFHEPGLDRLVARARAEGRLRVTPRLEEALGGVRVVLVCVGTPAGPRGAPDLRHVMQVAEALRGRLDGGVVAIKSTVPPGTSRRVQEILDGPGAGRCSVAACPEFLREGSAVEDFLRPDRVVLGVRTAEAAEVLEALHRGIDAPRVVTTPENAEMIKYAANALLAARVSLANEIAEICERVGADAAEVMRGVGLDPRIGPRFLQAGLGFGGPCLDKDLRALIRTAEDGGYAPRLLRAVRSVNASRVPRVLGRVRAFVPQLKGSRIGVLGLAFKPGTSDVRSSRALELVRALRRHGARVAAYDPRAAGEARRTLPGLRCVGSVEEAADGADCLVLATEWEEFLRVDWAAVAARMRRPQLVDARNFLEPRRMAASGFRYAGVGRWAGTDPA